MRVLPWIAFGVSLLGLLWPARGQQATPLPAFVTQAEHWLETHPVPREPFDEARYALMHELGSAGLENRWRALAEHKPVYWILLSYHASESGEAGAKTDGFLEQAPEGMHQEFAYAYAHYQKGEDSRAIAHLKNAVALASEAKDRTALYQSLANHHWQAGQRAAALAVWQDAWNQHADIATRLEMAKPFTDILVAMDQFEGFVLRLEKEASTPWPSALYLAEWYRRARWPVKAQAALDTLTETDRTRPEALRIAKELAQDQIEFLKQAELAAKLGERNEDTLRLLFFTGNQLYTRRTKKRLAELQANYLAQHREDLSNQPLRSFPWAAGHPEFGRTLQTKDSVESRFALLELAWKEQSQPKEALIEGYWQVFREARDGQPLSHVAQDWEGKRALPELKWLPLSQREAQDYHRSTSQVRSFDSDFRRPRGTVRDWPSDRLGNTAKLADEGHLRWIALKRLDRLLGRAKLLADLQAKPTHVLAFIYLDDSKRLFEQLIAMPGGERPLTGPVAQALFRRLADDLPKTRFKPADQATLWAYLDQLAESLWGRDRLARFAIAQQWYECSIDSKLPERAKAITARVQAMEDPLNIAWFLRKTDQLDTVAFKQQEPSIVEEIWRHDEGGTLDDEPRSLSGHPFSSRWQQLYEWLQAPVPAFPPIDGWSPFETSLSGDLKAFAPILSTLSKQPGTLGTHAGALDVWNGWDGTDTEARLAKALALTEHHSHLTEELLPLRVLLLADLSRHTEIATLLSGWEDRHGLMGVMGAALGAQALTVTGQTDQAQLILTKLETRGTVMPIRSIVSSVYHQLNKGDVARHWQIALQEQAVNRPWRSQEEPNEPTPSSTEASVQTVLDLLTATVLDQDSLQLAISKAVAEAPKALFEQASLALEHLRDRTLTLALARTALEADIRITEETDRAYAGFYSRLAHRLRAAGNLESALAALDQFESQLPEDLRDRDYHDGQRIKLHVELRETDKAATLFAKQALRPIKRPIWQWQRSLNRLRCQALDGLHRAHHGEYLEGAYREFVDELGDRQLTLSQSQWRVFAAAVLGKADVGERITQHLAEHPNQSSTWLEALASLLIHSSDKQAEALALLDLAWQSTDAAKAQNRLHLCHQLLSIHGIDDAVRQRCEQHLPNKPNLSDDTVQVWGQVVGLLLQRGWQDLADPIVDQLCAMDELSEAAHQALQAVLWQIEPSDITAEQRQKVMSKLLTLWPPPEPKFGDPHWDDRALRVFSINLQRHDQIDTLKALLDSVRNRAALGLTKPVRRWITECEAYLQYRSGPLHGGQTLSWLNPLTHTVQYRVGPANGTTAFYPTPPQGESMLKVFTRSDAKSTWAQLGELPNKPEQTLPSTWAPLLEEMKVESGLTSRPLHVAQGLKTHVIEGWKIKDRYGRTPQQQGHETVVFKSDGSPYQHHWESGVLSLSEERRSYLLQGLVHSPNMRVTLTTEILDADGQTISSLPVTVPRLELQTFASDYVIQQRLTPTELTPLAKALRFRLRSESLSSLPLPTTLRLSSLTLTEQSTTQLPPNVVFLPGKDSDYRQLSMSPDGNHLALYSPNRALTVFEVATHRNIDFPTAKNPGRLQGFGFVNDAKPLTLAVTLDKDIILWKPGQSVEKVHTLAESERFTFAPSGRWMCGIEDQDVRLYRLEPFAYERTLVVPKGNRPYPTFYREGDLVGLRSRRDSEPVFDCATGKPLEGDAKAAFWKHFFAHEQHGLKPDDAFRLSNHRDHLRILSVASHKTLAHLPWDASSGQPISIAILHQSSKTVYFLTNRGFLYRWMPEI